MSRIHPHTAALASLLLVGAVGCSDPPASPTVPKSAAPMKVHTELNALGEWIELPPGATATAWVVQPLGVADPRTPGPTDTVLTAYVAIDPKSWPSLERKLGASRQRGTLTLKDAVARAILPDQGAGAASTSTGAAFLAGAEYTIAPLLHPANADAKALRWRDGLVFAIYSR